MSKENKTIQQKTDELNNLIEWFSGADFELEQAIAKFKEAEQLSKEIESDLLSLKNEVNVIKQRFDDPQV